MESWPPIADLLWRNAIAVIPLALLVGLLCRWLPSRPSTRHFMWLVVLAWFVVPILLPGLQPAELLSVTPSDNEELSAAGADVPRGSRSWPTGRRVALRDMESDLAGAEPSEADRATSSSDSSAKRPVKLSAVPNPPRTEATVREPNRERQRPDEPQALAPGQRADEPQALAPGQRAEKHALREETRRWRSGLVRETRRRHSGRVKGGQVALRPPLRDEDFPVDSVTHAPASPGSQPLERNSGREEFRWRRWLIGLAAVRDTVGRLPSLPPHFWLSGMGVLLLVFAARGVRFRRVLRDADAAPSDVVRLVWHVADHMGLRAAPEVLMVDARVSPMIYCGTRARLILPRGLWAQLDRDGRAAIVSHELAHLRRKDHWICWIDLVLGSLFWWHPVMWWVRHRLHEEAEFCCDAWVTWLMPHGRRAYAEALLQTKGYISESRSAGPALGIGVATNRTQRFARRLKMVMTQSEKPRLSVAGLILVFGLASAGWAATPVWSHPDKKQKSQTPAVTIVQTAPKLATPSADAGDTNSNTFTVFTRGKQAIAPPLAADGRVVVTPCPPTVAVMPSLTAQTLAPLAAIAPAPPLVVPQLLTLYRNIGDDDRSMEKRMRRLERAIEKLSAQVERLGQGPQRRGIFGRTTPEAESHTQAESHARRGAGAVGIGGAHSRRGPIGPSGVGSGRGLGRRAPRAEPAPRPPSGIRGGSGGGSFFNRKTDAETLTFTYKLPHGKLAALINLMIRSDVPIVVSPTDNGIEVQGTARQQAIFKAFIDMINPKGKAKKSRGRASTDDGELRTFYDALTRQQQAGAEYAEQASKHFAEQAARTAELFARQQSELARTAQAARERSMVEARSRYEAAQDGASRYAEEVARAAKDATGATTQSDAQVAAILKWAEWMQSQVKRRTEQLAEIDNQMAALNGEADQMHAQAETLAQEAEELLDGEKDDDARARAKAVQDQARKLNRSARNLEQQAGRLERQADKLEDELQQLKSNAETAKRATKKTVKNKKSRTKKD